jgi:hypothetical protein
VEALPAVVQATDVNITAVDAKTQIDKRRIYFSLLSTFVSALVLTIVAQNGRDSLANCWGARLHGPSALRDALCKICRPVRYSCWPYAGGIAITSLGCLHSLRCLQLQAAGND